MIHLPEYSRVVSEIGGEDFLPNLVISESISLHGLIVMIGLAIARVSALKPAGIASYV